jgi:citrate lyase subunit beta / citryl-CoA lyase
VITRRRRAVLAVPGNSPRMLAKAATLEVDEVVVDLEDSVPPAEKHDVTRARLVDAINGLDWRAPTIAFRINGVATPWFRDDVAAIIGGAAPRVSSIVLPMAEGPADVLALVALLDSLAAGSPEAVSIGIEAQIETALGVVRVDEIASSSPRLEAILFGPGDFSASMGLPLAPIGHIDPSYPGDQWAYPRSRIAVAANAYGIAPIDGPYADFRDLAGLAESARRARLLGFTGKWVIHPDQIDVCTRVFSPSDDEQKLAIRLASTLEAAALRGEGATSLGGEMIDAANRRAVRRLLSD